MDSQTWDDVGRGAAFGALAAVALSGLGLRLSLTGGVRPADDGRVPARALGSQLATGAALGALYGFLRGRARQNPGALESGVYGLTLAALGHDDWAEPLGLAAAGSPNPR